MNQLFFITTNTYKFQQFKKSFASDVNLILEQLVLETPEIQAENNVKVAEFSAEWAANKTGKSVIKEDVGLYIDALGGFPGPYLAQMERWLGVGSFLKLLEGTHNRTAHWEYAVAYCSPGEKPISCLARQEGTISLEAKGSSGWVADTLFIPEGSDTTIAEQLDTNSYQRNNGHYDELYRVLTELGKV